MRRDSTSSHIAGAVLVLTVLIAPFVVLLLTR